jgi:hypothetical protein
LRTNGRRLAPELWDYLVQRGLAPTAFTLEEALLDDLWVAEFARPSGTKESLVVKRVIDSVPYGYLAGDRRSFLEYVARFGSRQHSEERFRELRRSVEMHGYPWKKRYISVFGAARVVGDGRHRAAILRHLWGNRGVPVLVIHR